MKAIFHFPPTLKYYSPTAPLHMIIFSLRLLCLVNNCVYRGSPTSTVSISTNFRAIGIELVLVEFLPDRYLVKLVLVEIGYILPNSTNFAWYDFFQITKIVLSKNLLYLVTVVWCYSVLVEDTGWNLKNSWNNTKIKFLKWTIQVRTKKKQKIQALLIFEFALF